MFRTLKLSIERVFLNLTKGIYKKKKQTRVNTIYNIVRLNAFTPKFKNKARMSAFATKQGKVVPFCYNIVVEMLGTIIRRKDVENEGRKEGKEGRKKEKKRKEGRRSKKRRKERHSDLKEKKQLFYLQIMQCYM